MSAYLVYVTAVDEAEAVRIARTVVEERLAACANLLGAIRSIYRWNGAVQDDPEFAFVLKTSAAQKQSLIERIVALHSYECPGISAFAVSDGHPPFLGWIEQSCGD